MKPTFQIEIELNNTYKTVAGVDEVGRGALAGPIVAAAVIFESYDKIKRKLKGVNDSKVLSSKAREELDPLIRTVATDFAIGEVSHEEIDKVGIGAANVIAFKRALDKLKKVDLALIDGRRFRGFEYAYRCLEKGESKSLSIAAASIIAKVYRDNLMIKLSDDFPEFNFASNKGYGGKTHHDKLKEIGPCPIHRKSFLKWLDKPRTLF